MLKTQSTLNKHYFFLNLKPIIKFYSCNGYVKLLLYTNSNSTIIYDFFFSLNVIYLFPHFKILISIISLVALVFF